MQEMEAWGKPRYARWRRGLATTVVRLPISLFTIPNALFPTRHPPASQKAKSTKRTHYFGSIIVCMNLETNNLAPLRPRMALPKKHAFSAVFMAFDHGFERRNPPFAHCKTLATA
jgi:hypothetical protein